jgi:hypothetical protein
MFFDTKLRFALRCAKQFFFKIEVANYLFTFAEQVKINSRTMEKPKMIAAEIVDFFNSRPELEGIYIAAPLEERPLIDAIKSSIGGFPFFFYRFFNPRFFRNSADFNRRQSDDSHAGNVSELQMDER